VSCTCIPDARSPARFHGNSTLEEKEEKEKSRERSINLITRWNSCMPKRDALVEIAARYGER
jgi:hypothetical protein